LPCHHVDKTEPETFGLADLKKSPDRTTCWDGVRYYQARNLLRDEVRVGDGVLFYHSNATPPGVAGVAKVASELASDARPHERLYEQAMSFAYRILEGDWDSEHEIEPKLVGELRLTDVEDDDVAEVSISRINVGYVGQKEPAGISHLTVCFNKPGKYFI